MANMWQGQRYFNATDPAPQVVMSGVGFLHTITINQTTNALVEIYDNTSAGGTVIGTIEVGTLPQTLTYDCKFGLGLTVTGALDLTITYM